MIPIAMIMDDVLWTGHRKQVAFTRAALASGREWDPSMAKEPMFGDSEGWIFMTVVSEYPDATINPSSLGEKDVAILKKSGANQLREATINGAKIDPSASLEIWGAGAGYNYHD